MTTAKPAGEPRWIPEDVRDLLNAASKHSRNLGEYWNKVTDALNAAETRAAQPPDEFVDESAAQPGTWPVESAIIKRIADRYKNCSIYITEYPEFSVVEAVLRCAAEVGFDIVSTEPQPGTPGDAPKLTDVLCEHLWFDHEDGRGCSCHTYENPYGTYSQDHATWVEHIRRLLANRSTPAAPAPPRFLDGAAAERVQKLLDDAEGTFAAPAATPPDGLEFRRIGSHTGEFSAPAPASTEAPGAPRLTAEDVIKAATGAPMPHKAFNQQVADNLNAILASRSAAPSTEALIAAGDALRKTLDALIEKWYDRLNNIYGWGESADCLQECAEELRAAVATLHPASEG